MRFGINLEHDTIKVTICLRILLNFKVLWPRGLVNYVLTYIFFGFQTLLWSFKFVIHENSRARHHRSQFASFGGANHSGTIDVNMDGSSLMKNLFLRCYNYLSLPDCIEVFALVLLLKLPSTF